MMKAKCPRCRSLEIKTSKRKNLLEWVALPVPVRPYRCYVCQNRFWGFALLSAQGSDRFSNPPDNLFNLDPRNPAPPETSLTPETPSSTQR